MIRALVVVKYLEAQDIDFSAMLLEEYMHTPLMHVTAFFPHQETLIHYLLALWHCLALTPATDRTCINRSWSLNSRVCAVHAGYARDHAVLLSDFRLFQFRHDHNDAAASALHRLQSMSA